MNKKLIGVAVAGLLAASAASFAADQVTESEMHYVRGLRDRSNLIAQVNQLALQKSTNASIKTFAKRTSEEYVASGKSMVEIAAKLGISGVGNMGGAPPNGGAAPNAAGGPPPGGAAQGAGGPPPTGAAGQGGQAQGGAGAQGRGNGPAARNQAVLSALEKFSGEDFDKAYLLTAIQLHEDIERNVLGEIMSPTANPQLIEWSKEFVVAYARNASTAQQLTTGQGDGNVAVPVSGSSPEAANRKGPTIEQMTPGALFGVTIGVKK